MLHNLNFFKISLLHFLMTVIVGLETNVGGKAVVIGSDRLQLTQEHAWVKCLGLIEKSKSFDLSPYFSLLKKTGRDKVIMSSKRKINISPDEGTLLAHTGVDNKANEQVNEFLLDTKRFLKNSPLLTALFFPIGCPRDDSVLESYLQMYKSSFSLERSLFAGFIPEVRRIFDIHTAGLNVRETPFGILANWDRNYNPVLSEYLFAKLLDGAPGLFEITATGAVAKRQYFANGAGGMYALEHMRERLGTQDVSLFHPAESKIEKSIGLKDAVEIVSGAVGYACYCNNFCRGFDYVVLRKEGVESHFSDEEFSCELSVSDLIDRRIKRSVREVEQLRRIKNKYEFWA